MGKYVIQRHHARTLHYDLRLQMGNVLKSWALPKGAPRTTKERRLAIPTPDHAMSYGDFEGTIPKGHYGAGKVEIWDRGTFKNIRRDKQGKLIPIARCYEEGQIEIEISGDKLRGGYALIRFRDTNWLFIKKRGDVAKVS